MQVQPFFKYIILAVIVNASGYLMTQVVPGIYRHYKGPLYKVIGTGMHTETEETLVFYQSQYGKFEFWARPLEMWLENVEYEGQNLQRFTYISPE
jgi:hypothetical protein